MTPKLTRIFARSSPANEAVVASGVRTEVVWQIAPRCSRSQDPEDTIEDTTVVHPRHAAWFVGQHRSDGSPLIVGEFVAHDSTPSVRGPSTAPLSGNAAHPQLRVASLITVESTLRFTGRGYALRGPDRYSGIVGPVRRRGARRVPARTSC